MEEAMRTLTRTLFAASPLLLATACQTMAEPPTSAGNPLDLAPRAAVVDRAAFEMAPLLDQVLADEAAVAPRFRETAATERRDGARVIHAMQRTLRYTGQDLYRLVLFDEETGETRKVDVDPEGHRVDYQAANEANRALAYEMFGDLSEELDRELQGLDDGDEIDVEIWVEAPAPPLRPDPVDGTGSTRLDVDREEYAAVLGMARAAVVEDIHRQGGEILFEAAHAPIVEARLTRAAIEEVFRSRDDVTGIVLSRREEPKIAASVDSSRDMNLEQFHQLNAYGIDVKVGMTEACNDCGIWGEIWNGNPNLWFDYTERSAPRSCTTDAHCAGMADASPQCVDGVCQGWHPTTVAGMIGMLPDFSQIAGAPIVDLVFANGSGSHAQVLDWQVNQDVTVTNESWIGAYTNPNAQDYYSRTYGMSITRAAGNYGVNSGSSCAAGNLICVAGYDPEGTPDTWADDTFYNATSSKNMADCPGPSPGFGCDREVPDVTGHGENCTSSTNDDADADGLQSGLNGTSFAAPAIAGTVALMQDRQPMFEYWPEAVRAVLMTSANHDILTPTAGKTYSDYRAPDERDGAGVPNAARIVSILDNSRWSASSLTPANFDGNSKRVMGSVVVDTPGTRIRAVAAWSTCPTGTSSGTTGISADFDLHILDPNGANVMNAASYDGSHEIGEIVATAAGTYTFELQSFRWDTCHGSQQEYVGFAYDVIAP
jgi:hypothetical protein